MNVQPLRCLGCPATAETIDPALVALQLEAVYELGFDGIRITAPLGDRNSFLAAIPYVRAARALGIDALVLLADFSGLTLARALHDDRRRRAILELYADVFAPAPEPARPGLGGLGPRGAGRIAFQILNEPVGFVGVPPDVYVREILAPCFQDLSDLADDVIVVGAAEAGNRSGPPRVHAMLEAGLEQNCDRIAYHVYAREVIPMLSDNVRQIVWITESGSAGTASHLAWVQDVFPEIRDRIGDVLRIFYFDLFDPDRGVFRVLDIVPEGDGYRAVVESAALHGYWSARVSEAAAGHPIIAFATLVPDIRVYFPTPADVLAFDGAPRE
jgi:sugar phosphate isomerase/epimerase